MIKLRVNGSEFWVATCHMPCKFWNQPLMNAYAALLVQIVQKTAQDVPYVFAGDFNLQPDSETYAKISQGWNGGDLQIPMNDGNLWTPKLNAMRSAYVVANGEEPELTNYAVRSGKFGKFK